MYANEFSNLESNDNFRFIREQIKDIYTNELEDSNIDYISKFIKEEAKVISLKILID